MSGMAEWFSIEVYDGRFSASSWRAAYADAMLFAAHGLGVSAWAWRELDWGIVFEVELPDEVAWEEFCNLVTVRAALDAVPDPINGLVLHRGRGGSDGIRQPRPRRPSAGADAVALPVPVNDIDLWQPAGAVLTAAGAPG